MKLHNRFPWRDERGGVRLDIAEGDEIENHHMKTTLRRPRTKRPTDHHPPLASARRRSSKSVAADHHQLRHKLCREASHSPAASTGPPVVPPRPAARGSRRRRPRPLNSQEATSTLNPQSPKPEDPNPTLERKEEEKLAKLR